MEIETLRVLVETAQLGSFAAVARGRGLDPSTVSRMVAQAEQALGIRVFQRTTRRLSLTEAGESFVRSAESIVDEFGRAHEAARGNHARATGSLRLTTSVAFGQIWLVPLLSQFRAAFPELSLELVLTDSNVDLIRDRIDLAIRLAPAIEGDVVCAKLRDTRYRVCASPGYLQSCPPLARPSDLTNHQSLLFSFPGFRSRWLFRSRSKRLTEVPVLGAIVISNALGLRDAALAGLGPALLADWLIDRDLDAGRLIDVFPKFDVTATTFETAAWLVYPSRSFLPAKVRLMIDFLRANLGRSSAGPMHTTRRVTSAKARERMARHACAHPAPTQGPS
jgi:DNA-binding transcriptional LysR family regulator